MKKLSILIITIFLIPLIIVGAPTSLYQVSDGEDDGFLTATGIWFDTALLHLIDNVQDTTTGIRFQNVTITQGVLVDGAILSLYVSTTYSFDRNSRVTIYGIDITDCPPFTGNMTGYPVTTAFINVNTSTWTSPGWYNVSVTNIVREITGRVMWVYGNDMGFRIEGISRIHPRHVHSFDSSPARAPRLYVSYNPSPPVPPILNTTYPNATFVYNTTYRECEIWMVVFNSSIDFDYIVSGTSAPGSAYYNRPLNPVVSAGSTPPEIMTDRAQADRMYPARRNIVRSDLGVLYAVLERDISIDRIYLYNSTNGGLNWTSMGRVLYESTFDGFAQEDAHIEIDNDNDELYIFLRAQNSTDGLYQIYVRSFNIPARTWGSYEAITWGWATTSMKNPSAFLDSQGLYQVVWDGDQGIGTDQVWYTNGTIGSWETPLRLSSTYENQAPGIVAEPYSAGGQPDLCVVWRHDRGGGHLRIYTRERYGGSWLAILNHDGSISNPADDPDIGISPYNNNYFIIYPRWIIGGYRMRTREGLGNNVWNAHEYITTDVDFRFPSIGFDSRGYPLAIFTNNNNDDVYYNTYTTLGTWSPSQIRLTTTNIHDQGGASITRRAVEVAEAFIYVGVCNGTLVDGDEETGCTDLNCTEEKIDDHHGYPDPEDPEPHGWEDQPVSRNMLKLLFFLAGFGLILAPSTIVVLKRPGAHYWVVVMMFGLLGYIFLAYIRYL